MEGIIALETGRVFSGRVFGAPLTVGGVDNVDEALETAAKLEYPVRVRSRYVFGGRAMRVVYHDDGLRRYFEEARSASSQHPVLIDQFLEDAVEFDGNTVSDGRKIRPAGHRQEALAIIIPCITTLSGCLAT